MLTKTIWLLWLQGWNNAPWLVKQVARSWEINNPDWNVEYITLENLHKYVHDIGYIFDKTKNIGPQHKADIIRLSLLKNYGGVWADATMLCMQPLNPWIESAVKPAGLWMYHGHGAGMNGMNGPSIWLIASEKHSLMISRWKNACDVYWRDRDKADNYFWLDGLFKKLFESDPEFRGKWALAPHLYSELKGQAHSLAYRSDGMSSDDKNLKRILRETPPYALKFWWKEWQDAFPDISAPKCKNSNGYYAIQMSKRRFIFLHQMSAKDSISLRMKMFVRNIQYIFKLKIGGRIKNRVINALINNS
ncbi:hypothetical protein C7271_00650 [filamentous cyanobacterium CCP5]|nr:hypothetical protein C7271_00650 [filamentous cyanobacterium CCP5]